MFYEASRMQHCLAWMFCFVLFFFTEKQKKRKEIIHLHFDESLALEL